MKEGLQISWCIS